MANFSFYQVGGKGRGQCAETNTLVIHTTALQIYIKQISWHHYQNPTALSTCFYPDEEKSSSNKVPLETKKKQHVSKVSKSRGYFSISS